MSDERHFDGKRFFNPNGANGRGFRDVPRMLTVARSRWPRDVPITPRRPPPLERADDIIVTFVGHATFLIQTGAGNLLTDPFFSRRASPVPFAGPRRSRAPGVRIEDLPPIATILLSHNHYDHCDLAALRALARRFDPLLVTPLGNARFGRAAGMRRVEELDWWQQLDTGAMRVVATPAQHFSARHPFDRNEALWAGFRIEVAGRRLYFAGDSGYGPHFKEIGARLGPPDLALLPIGAYEPRWFMKDIHMNPEEAVAAHLDVGSRLSVAMHHATIQLTPEPIDAPAQALAVALAARGIGEDRFRIVAIGDSVTLPG